MRTESEYDWVLVVYVVEFCYNIKQRMLQYSSSMEPPIRPTKLLFGILSSREIKRMSVCCVTNTILYYRGLPASGGLLDPLMGTVDRRHLCASCMQDTQNCQGHPGYIELSFPMYHIGFIDVVIKTLRLVCFHCTRLCVSKAEIDSINHVHGRARLTALHNMCRLKKVCPHCNICRPTYTRASLGIDIQWPVDMQWESDEERAYCTAIFSAREALSILRNISDKDVSSIGFNVESSHPMHMIVQHLVVPPPCTRPAIYASEGSRSRGQNDLTVRLMEVLKRSQELGTFTKGVHWRDIQLTTAVMERLLRLQYEVFILVSSNSRIQKPPGMGRVGATSTVKSISDRLKGKEGRVRGNLMGKRVDFSARCVITPDAYFDCDRVGIPYSIAMKLTIPEIVNSINIGSLTKRVHCGGKHIGGAANIIMKTGIVIDLSNCKHVKDIELAFGDVVERYLQDDDTVIFNRQPSLHMHSMQAHRVRLMPGHTFRLSLVAAAPYNADFDGDEMNIHVPQSKASIGECAILMGVAQNCIGPQANRPVMGIVQDTLLALHLATSNTTLLTHTQMCRIIGILRYTKYELPTPAVVVYVNGNVTTTLWTGKQLFSSILPKELFVEHVLGDIEENDADMPVIILSGQHLCGVLTKRHLGTSSGGIVDVICREFGGFSCLRFMGEAQRMSHMFLLQKGHHVGINDVMLSSEGQGRVHHRLQKATCLCEEIERDVVGASPGVSQLAERAILRLLSKMLLQTGGLVDQYMSKDNAIRLMVSAGSKGSFINLSQIAACLGQQSLEGARIVATKGNRTLPCFAHDEISLASKGMVLNSFALGLSPSELFYHAVGGREGLVDTAVKTSQTGYLQRRMNKSMEDHTIHEDGIVRNATGDVISYIWGSGGMHPSYVERVPLSVLSLPEIELCAYFTNREMELIVQKRNLVLQVKTHLLVTGFDSCVLLPFHPERIKGRLRRLSSSAPPVDHCYVWGKVTALCETTTPAICVSLIDVFSAMRLKTITKLNFDVEFEKVVHCIHLAAAPNGESVGCIAAQSIGEPCTQMTLNTFHYAGCSSKNVTMGIPRLKELIDVSRSPRTPCTTIRFLHPFTQSEMFANYMAATIPLIRFGDVVISNSVLFEPSITSTTIDEDSWIVHVENVLQISPVDNYSQYIVRLILNKEIMKIHHLTPPMVRKLLAERLQDRALIYSSETNAIEWIIRIRFLHVQAMIDWGGLSVDQEKVISHRASDVLLETVIIGGCCNVSSAAVEHTKRVDMLLSNGGVAKDEYVVHVYGEFLADSACSPCIDWTRCTSNDIWETYSILGIEACVHVLFDQIKAVVSFDGTYIDDCHILLLVDTITRNGSLMPLNRHGINRTDSSPLMRCSFEETTDILCDAAIYSESENAKGVTTSIMSGQLANFGTGRVCVLFGNQYKQNQEQHGLREKGVVMTSTCRSHLPQKHKEVMEYVFDTKKSARRIQMEEEYPVSKRCRFRPMSPTSD